VAALIIIFMMGGAPPISALGVTLAPVWLALPLVALYVVWMLNLTNFMDGLDGIVGVETLTTCISAGVLGELVLPGAGLWIAPALLATATLGFLCWNWPPAKIFMGDAGSGYVGLMLAGLSLVAAQFVPRLFWCWVILVGVFVVDTTMTLVRRVLSRERIFQAHRTHAFQYAARHYGSHLAVTVGVGVINVAWLLPVAYLVARGSVDGLVGCLIAYAPLVVVAHLFRAGKRES